MSKVKAFAAQNEKDPLNDFELNRRDPSENEVMIDILYCGVCHSDIHMVRNEWGGAIYPMVPGHEIVGTVSKVGANVNKYKIGDLVGVGCMVNSCGDCSSCADDEEQFCLNGFTATYGSMEKERETPTYGGYSQKITVKEDFVLRVSEKLDTKAVAPLLCAGITTYSPLKHWGAAPGKKIAIVGLGGLGHMGVKLAHSFGADVTVFTTSLNKKEDALRLGAVEVINSKDEEAMKSVNKKFDIILDTVSADHDLNSYLQCLNRNGTMILVGLPEKPAGVSAGNLIMGRKSLAGSLIGGIKETQEMLDYCAEKGITSDVEMIPIQKVNEAYERMIKGDVKYRFVIDMSSSFQDLSSTQ